MKTSTKILMIIALSLLLAGVILSCVGVALMDFNFMNLNTAKTVEKTYEVTEEFTSISISEKTADVTFLPSEDGTVRIVCTENKKTPHSVSVENGVLTVRLNDMRKWYDYLSIFSFTKIKTTIYLPKDAYKNLTVKTNTGNLKMPQGYSFERATLFVNTGNVSWESDVLGALMIDGDTSDVKIANATLASLKLETDTGDVKLEKISAGAPLELETNTGDIRMTNVRCDALKLETDTGDVTLTDTVAANHAEIETDTGDVKFTRADAATLNIKTDTGNVTGSLRTEKIFNVKSKTGKERVPETLTGGLCRIRCSTGDIRITLENVD